MYTYRMKKTYIIVITLLLSFGTLNAAKHNTKSAGVYEELEKIKIENQLLKQKVDFLNSNFEIRLKAQNEDLQKNLDYTIANCKMLMEQQNKNHLIELDNQFWIFGLFSAIISIIAFLLSWIGIRYIKRKIKKTIENNRREETKRLVNTLAESPEFINIIKAQLDVVSMEQLDENSSEVQYEE